MDNKIMVELESNISLLEQAYKEYLKEYKAYKEIQNSLWLNTDWEEAIGKSRPTVDEKKAFISQKSLNQKMFKDNAEFNIKIIKQRIELCKLKLEYTQDE